MSYSKTKRQKTFLKAQIEHVGIEKKVGKAVNFPLDTALFIIHITISSFNFTSNFDYFFLFDLPVSLKVPNSILWVIILLNFNLYCVNKI